MFPNSIGNLDLPLKIIPDASLESIGAKQTQGYGDQKSIFLEKVE